MIWNSIQKNKDILKEVGLRVDVYENILEDDAEKQNYLNILLACKSIITHLAFITTLLTSHYSVLQ